MPALLEIFFMSMVPLGELRLAIPVGLLVYKLGVFEVVAVSVIGNTIPIIVILLFLKKFLTYITGKFALWDQVFSWWKKRAEDNSELIQKYGAIGLAIFIGIPFPMTGAWTGALLAVLMDLPLTKSIPAVFSGVLIAGLLVAGVVLTGIKLEDFFGWGTLLAILATVAVFYIFFKHYNNRRKK